MRINGLTMGMEYIIFLNSFGFSEECATRLGEDP